MSWDGRANSPFWIEIKTYWRISVYPKQVYRIKLTSSVGRGKDYLESTEDSWDPKKCLSGWNFWSKIRSKSTGKTPFSSRKAWPGKSVGQFLIGPDFSLTTSQGIIEGKIKKYYGLNSEMFSGLFEGPMGAGTVIMSVSPGTGSIHANVLFKGIAKEGQENVNFVLKFHTTHQGETRSVEESVILDSVGAVGGEWCSVDYFHKRT